MTRLHELIYFCQQQLEFHKEADVEVEKCGLVEIFVFKDKYNIRTKISIKNVKPNFFSWLHSLTSCS